MVQTKPRRLNGSVVETFGMLNHQLLESGVETVSVSQLLEAELQSP